MTLADRVANERGELLGETVGVSISFVDRCSEKTHIKVYNTTSCFISLSISAELKFPLLVLTVFQYMTEGILLNEMLADPLLQKYAVIMIDEAHERNIFTDDVLGLLKKIIKVFIYMLNVYKVYTIEMMYW